jgi:hypothetical protein
LRVLVACENSGTVRDAFKALGHDAWSCDILPTASPGQHIQADIRTVLNAGWDMMVAHPPCTRLCNSGVSWLNRRDLWTDMYEAAAFFNQMLNARIPMIAVENPVPHKYAKAIIGKYNQTIQPYQFGHSESKRTCLWLRGLPKLKPTDILPLPACGHWDNQTESGQNKLGPSPDRGLLRAKTYEGIAEAMANQWGGEHVAPVQMPLFAAQMTR